MSDGAGAVGNLLKDRVSDIDDLADAIGRIEKGGSVIDPSVVAALVDHRRVLAVLAHLRGPG